MHSRYSTSDKDANAGRSSVENSGNTKNAWGEKMTSGKVGTHQVGNFKCTMDNPRYESFRKPPALQVVMPPLTLLSNSYEKQQCQLAKEGNKSISQQKTAQLEPHYSVDNSMPAGPFPTY
ncbi:hypothetical protein Peur_008405 [Populus x canadensis]